MKKRLFKVLSGKVLAAATGAAVFVSAYAPTLASADEPAKYISEVFLSYGEDANSAKQWLTDNGYTILDQDLNEDADGAFSTKRSVYLGYKTTSDESKAIRDMRAMNMNGNYSYDEYKKLLENKKSEINSFVSDMKTVLAEYRENYKKGVTKATLAHDKINLLLDDDCDDAPLGDLLLKNVREEMKESVYKEVEKEHADLTTLLMQGNLSNVSSLLNDLCLAADTANDTWLSRLRQSNGIEGLIEKYQKLYPNLPESKLYTVMRSEYDDEAKLLADKFSDLRESMKAYTECEVKADDDQEKVDAYFKAHPEKSSALWSLEGTKYTIMSEVKFGDTDLNDLINGNDLNYDDPDDRMALYPIIESLSPGQRCLLYYVDFGELLIAGNLTEENWAETAEKNGKILKTSTPRSVYEGIDRSMFEPGGVALTSEARQLQSATGSNYSNRIFGEYSTYFEVAGFVTGVIILTAGICSLSHANALVKAGTNASNSFNVTISDLATKEDALGTSFYNVIQSKNIEYVDGVTMMNEIEVDQAKMNQLYSVIKKNAESNKKIDIYIDNKWDTIDGKELLDQCKEADKTLEKSMADYNTACELANTENSEKLADTSQKTLDRIGNSAYNWKLAGKILCVAGALIAVGSAVTAVYDIYKYYHQDYVPIPRMIVHESTDEKGRSVYTAYNAALCNRKAKGFKNDDLGDYGDMNGDVGKQWLALYTSTDKAAGDPITADMIAQKGSNKFPTDKDTTVRLFGQEDSVNIVSTDYCYNDKLGGLYIFCSTAKTNENTAEKPADSSAPDAEPESGSAADTSSETETASEAAAPAEDSSSKAEATAAGSVVGTGVMVGSCVGSAALGALICFLILRLRRKENAA
jgi:hypothetical protein